MFLKKKEKYYLGLDIGTDSIGWAVTDPKYNLIKYKKNAMWGSYCFDAANLADERRGFRTAQRRLDRRQARINILQELFAEEIAKTDSKFFIRLKESALWAEDKSTKSKNALFDDEAYTDADYHEQFPTIHHLIVYLMNVEKTYDIRLLYIACAYLIAHRGHFLIDVNKENLDAVTDFSSVYNGLMDCFSDGIALPWECSSEDFAKIMKKKISVSKKKSEFKALLWNGKKPQFNEDEDFLCRPDILIDLISGGKCRLSDLFANDGYKELENNSVTLASADFDDIFSQLRSSLDDEQCVLLEKAKAVYDWALLVDILNNRKYISEAKVDIYEQHKKDVAFLKKIIKKYLPKKYNEVFRDASDKNNYTAYSYNVSSVHEELPEKFKKCTQEEFCKYLRSVVSKIDVDDDDKDSYDDMISRLEDNSFCPKQVTGDNRVIPYQLYWNELNLILKKAEPFFDFLGRSDKYCTVSEKILSLMEFRVPYYVGPLVSANKSSFAWMVKRSDAPDEKIYPWNFNKIVDRDASEEAFIKRMTCKCTYCAGEDVLPQCSLLYSKFCVLNEINNIRINNEPISVECKQLIYTELFEKYRKVTVKRIKDLLISTGNMKKDDEISGVDITIKSSLNSYHDFKSLISRKVITEADAEEIIKRITYTQDKNRLKKWLKANYKLSDDDLRYVSRLNYTDFGRLSAKVLTGYQDLKDGQICNPNIIEMLWETNYNLMQLLSDRFSYSAQIQADNTAYYADKPQKLNDRLDEMYISNAVKRPIIRTLDIVKEIGSIMGGQPEKIFIEMARGANADQKKKRTSSRREQITALFDKFPADEVRELSEQLDSKSDAELQSEKLFLYFTQLGKCMYSGQSIDITKLSSNEYNVDHIYPQSKTEDDSISNKVLVLSVINDKKKDTYPLSEVEGDIQGKMTPFWTMLRDKELISKIKYDRLTRKTGFTDDELAGFINRQLVETRQSTKAVAELLGEMFPESEIVYVKAGIVSKFRQEYSMLKCRCVNDLHHAKDAYLNIVMGNVYNVRFTKNPANFIKSGEKYTLNLMSMLKYDISRNGVFAWDKEESIANVRNTVNKNNIRYVRYSYVKKGGLFDANPMRRGKGQIPLKKGLDINKYGGYNKATVSYFYLIKYKDKSKQQISFVPIELYRAADIKTSDDVKRFCENELGFKDVTVLLNGRKIKINTLLEIDGFRANLSCKSNNTLWFKGGMQLVLGSEWEEYVKRLSSFSEKYNESVRMKRTPYKITAFNKIDKEHNCELYTILKNKLSGTVYSVLMATPISVLEKGEKVFEELSVEDQSIALLHIIELFGCSNPGGKDLTLINGKAKQGILTLNMNISNSKGVKCIRIIDQSPTGLIEKRSENLLEL